MGASRRVAVFAIAVALGVMGFTAGPQSASAEPEAPPVPPEPCPADATCDIEYKRFGNVPILLDVYQPTSGTNLPAVVLVHGGAWRDGDKLGQTQIDVADFMRDRGLVVFVINYRLTCVTK